MRSRAITLLGWFGVIAGAFGVAGVFLYPWLLQKGLGAKYREFGVTEEMIDRSMPFQGWDLTWITGGGLLSLASMVCGVGLVRRWSWSRRGCLVMCVLWMIWTVIFASFPGHFEWRSVPEIVLRLAVLGVSFGVLARAEARGEFSRVAGRPDEA